MQSNKKSVEGAACLFLYIFIFLEIACVLLGEKDGGQDCHFVRTIHVPGKSVSVIFYLMNILCH